MTSYSNDPRLTYRIKHIQNERKLVTSNVVGTKPHTTTTSKIEGTKRVEDKAGNPTLGKPVSKPNAVATPIKGGKRS